MKNVLLFTLLFSVLPIFGWSQDISGTFTYTDGKKYDVVFDIQQDGQSIFGDVSTLEMKNLFFGGELIKEGYALLEIRNKASKAHLASAEFTLLDDGNLKLTFSKNKKRETGLPEDIILTKKN